MIVCLNHPSSFNKSLKSVSAEAQVVTDPEVEAEIAFAVAFITQQEEIDQFVLLLVPRLKGAAIL